MKIRNIIVLQCLTSIIFTASGHAGDAFKANNTTALNDPASWVSETVPTSDDIVVWNSTVTSANNSALGGNLAWQGIRIVSPGGGVTISGSTGPATLTLGAAGINMSAATQNLTFGATIPVILSASQTWNVGTSRLLTYGSGAATSIDLNGITLDTSGAGNIVIANRYNLTSATPATINVNNASFSFESGGSTTVSLGSDITVNVAAGKVYQLRGNSGSGGIGINANGPVNMNGGIFRIASSNTVQINQSGKVTMADGSTLDNTYGNNSVNSRLQLSGGLEVTGTTTWKESNSSATATIFNSALTGDGTINFQNTTTTRRADWSGDNSGFTGTVNLNGASGNRNLRLTGTTAGSASATWAPAAGNTLEVDGVFLDLGTLNGAGTVTNSHATDVATISVGAGTFSGVISNGTPTDGMVLTKTGSGVLALTGANSYTGLTDVQAGTLTTTSAQTGGGAVTVADGATFGVTQVNDGDTFNVSTLTLGSAGGSTLELTSAASPSAALVTAGTFTVNGTATLRVKGLPVAGTTLVAYGAPTGPISGLNLEMPFRIEGTLNDNGSTIVLTTVTDETPKWRDGDGLWDINTTGSWKTSATGTTTTYQENGPSQIDTVIFDDTSSGTSPITVTLNSTVSPVAMTVTGAKDYTITGTGTIAGTTGIAKSGSSALTLATANTFSGGVQINEGTLNINHASALGSGTLTLADGIVLNNTSGAAISASPSVASVWNGSFTFTGANDLTLGGAVTVTAEPTVTVAAGTLAVGGIAGSGFGLTKEGAGALVIGAGTYNGSTVVNAGTLRAGAAAAFASTSGVTLADVAGVNLDLNGFNQTIATLSGGGTTGGNVLLGGGILTTSSSGAIGALSGAGGLVKNSTTTLTVAGDTTGYTGTTTINGGVLDVGNVGNFLGSSGVLTMTNGAVLQGAGSLTRTVGNGNAVVSGFGGFAARGGPLDVDLDDPTVAGASFFNFNSGGNSFGGALVLGSTTADSLVRVLSSIGINNFGGSRTVSVPVGAGGDSAELAGAVTPGSAGGASGILKNGGGLLTLSAANTYTGNTTVNEGSLTLATTGQLMFKPTTNGSANKVFDSTPDTVTPALNPVTLDGAFVIDLSTAVVATGNTWTLVDMASVAAVHGASFSVVDFLDDDMDNKWTKVDGLGHTWTYDEATGVLSVVPGGFSSWIAGFGLAVADQDPTDDPDNDGIINLVEYAIAGQDPTVGNPSIGTFIGNTLSFTKRLPLASDLTYAIETSVDLGVTPWAEPPVGPTYVNDGTTISYQLPGTNATDFMRLKVTKTP